MIRRPTIDDIPNIEDISKKYDFELPNKFYSAAVIERHDNIIGFGILRWILEAIMITDGSNRDKVESVIELIGIGIADTPSGEQLHCFVEDEHFAKILQERFNFRPVKGIALVLDVE